MSDEVGPISYAENEEHSFLGREVTKTVNHSEATAQSIDAEVKRLLAEAYEDTRRTLSAHIDGLHRIAQALLEHETLSADEMRLVLQGGDIGASKAAARDRDERARRLPAPGAKPASDAGPRPAAGPGAEPQGGFAY